MERSAAGHRRRTPGAPRPVRPHRRPPAWGRRDDPPLHPAPRWARSGASRPASSRCSASRSRCRAPRRARGLVPRRGAGRDRGSGHAWTSSRIAEIEQTTDHDVIAFVSQVAESGRAARPLHPLRPDQQRRRGHRARAAMPGGRRPLLAGHRRPHRDARRPARERGRHPDDGPHPFRARRADHPRAEAGRLGLRARPRPRPPAPGGGDLPRARSPGLSAPTASLARTSRPT